MEFYLDVPWLCFLCKRSSSKSISHDLSLQNKKNEIVQEKSLNWNGFIVTLLSDHFICHV